MMHQPHLHQPWRLDRCKPFIHSQVLSAWPPHINLLYPFYEDAGDSFGELADTLAAAVRSHSSLQGAMGFQPQQACCAA